MITLKYIAVAAFVSGSLAVQSQTVPALINYQGKLVNSNGLPVSTGDYQLRFRIYDAVTNGNLIWGPQVFNGQTGPGYGPIVPVVQGWFNVILGPADTNGVAIANAFSASNRYLEIQIGTNPPFNPRQQILSAPFALRSGTAIAADTALIANTVPDGSITGAKIGSGAVGSNQIAPQAVQTVHIANGAVGSAQLAAGVFGFVPRSIQIFTASGVWTKPVGVSNVYVKVIGRGGNGGSANDSRPKGGGGGGGYAEGFIAVTGDVAVVIGAINSFAGVSMIQATAGGNASGPTGGAGGVGSGGAVNLTGGAGQNVSGAVVNGSGGMGGASAMGAGGTGGGYNGGASYSEAGNGGNFGGGGGGATNEPRSGGNGDPGAVIVYY